MNRLTRKYILLGGSFFSLLIIFLFLQFLEVKNKSYIPRVGKFSKIKKIEISSPVERNLVLFLSNNIWYVLPENFEVDEEYISNLVGLLERFEIVDLVTKNPNLKNFDLNEEKKITLKVHYNGKQQIIFFGKDAPTKKHMYLSIPKDKSVYLGKGNFYFELNKTKEDVRSKKILVFKNEDIVSISWMEEGKNYSIFPFVDSNGEIKGKTSWLGKEINLKNYIPLLNLYAIEFKKDLLHNKYLRKIRISTKNSNYVVTVFFQDKEGDYYIGIGGRKEYYKITKFAGDNLMKSYTNFE